MRHCARTALRSMQIGHPFVQCSRSPAQNQKPAQTRLDSLHIRSVQLAVRISIFVTSCRCKSGSRGICAAPSNPEHYLSSCSPCPGLSGSYVPPALWKNGASFPFALTRPDVSASHPPLLQVRAEGALDVPGPAVPAKPSRAALRTRTSRTTPRPCLLPLLLLLLLLRHVLLSVSNSRRRPSPPSLGWPASTRTTDPSASGRRALSQSALVRAGR